MRGHAPQFALQWCPLREFTVLLDAYTIADKQTIYFSNFQIELFTTLWISDHIIFHFVDGNIFV